MYPFLRNHRAKRLHIWWGLLLFFSCVPNFTLYGGRRRSVVKAFPPDPKSITVPDAGSEETERERNGKDKKNKSGTGSGTHFPTRRKGKQIPGQPLTLV